MLPRFDSRRTELASLIGERNVRAYQAHLTLFIAAGVLLMLELAVVMILIVARAHANWVPFGIGGAFIGALALASGWIALRLYARVTRMYQLPFRSSWDLPLSDPHKFRGWVERHGGERA